MSVPTKPRRKLHVTRPKKRSQLEQHITQHFWTRWRNEYLTLLREFDRYKRRNGHNVKVGDIELVHKESPRNTWPLGVVEELIPGGDGAVRTVRFRTKGDHYPDYHKPVYHGDIL